MSSKWHGGKGSTPRPLDKDKWAENYERVFGKKNKEKKDDRSS